MKFVDALLESPRSIGVWRWYRAVAIGLAIAFLLLFAKACWVNALQHRGIDFISFWAAARLTLLGHPPLAYDIVVHGKMESIAAASHGILPFPYPPPFLLVILPCGIGPSWLSFPFWVVVTGSIYLFASRPFATLPYALAQPAVFLNAIIGQNGFLTSGIFMLGASWLARAPFIAGAIWGLLVIKPQLAVLLPVALIAGREWKAILGGVTSTLAMLLIALLLFGAETYAAFFRILQFYAPFYAQSESATQWPWGELASPFALLRYLGTPQVPALVIHAAMAAGASLLTWLSWARARPERVAVLAAATLLISPYTFTYDSLLMLLPIAWLVKQRRQPIALASIFLCCLLPVGALGTYDGPNTVPLACILALWALHRRPGKPVAPSPVPAVS